ncbi:MAG: hypothetical protein ACRDL0_00785 [Thermoleophilaceae bacterium]
MVLFRLPDYDLAARRVAYGLIEVRLVAHAPDLAAFPTMPVPQIRPERVGYQPGSHITVEPVQHHGAGRFDIRAVVAGDFTQLGEELDTAARSRARALLAFATSTLNDVTDATGNVVHGTGEPSWEALMTMIEKAPIGFDADGRPTFAIWPARAAERFASLPPKTPEQQERGDALMALKRREFDARQRDRRLA